MGPQTNMYTNSPNISVKVFHALAHSTINFEWILAVVQQSFFVKPAHYCIQEFGEWIRVARETFVEIPKVASYLYQQ